MRHKAGRVGMVRLPFPGIKYQAFPFSSFLTPQGWEFLSNNFWELSKEKKNALSFRCSCEASEAEMKPASWAGLLTVIAGVLGDPELGNSIHLHPPFLLGGPSHWWWAQGGRRARAESCWCSCDEEITCTLSRWCEEAAKQFWEAPAGNLIRWHWLGQAGVGCSPPHLTLHNVACPWMVTCSTPCTVY